MQKTAKNKHWELLLDLLFLLVPILLSGLSLVLSRTDLRRRQLFSIAFIVGLLFSI